MWSEGLRRFLDGVGGGKTCTVTGKIKYATKRLAHKSGKTQAAEYGKMNSYECRHCHYWHLGHSSEKYKPGGKHERKERRNPGPHRADPNRTKS